MARRKKADKQRRVLHWLMASLGLLLVLGLILLWRIPQAPPATVEMPPEIPENEYQGQAFYRDGELLCYGAGEYLAGIDVSAHQGVIDWDQVKAAGVEFVVIRAGYRGSTEGLLYEDEQFRYNMEGAQRVGIPIAVYFYSQALNREEAVEEAEFVCGLLEDYAPELPVFYDWELGSGTGRIASVHDVPLTDCAVAFCEHMIANGYAPGVYFNMDYGYNHLDLLRLQDYTLWLAEYNETPTFRYHFDWLQYTDKGSVPGISVPVDLDIQIVDEVTSTNFVVVNEQPSE